MPSRAAWVEINLGAIAHNYGEIRKHIQKDAKLCAVVKADAYGHGAIAVARKAIAAGAEYLALATISEALKLREAGFTTPLLILGLTKAENSIDIVDAHITQTVCRLDLAEALSAEAVCQNKTVKVHLAVDTGLGRIGVRPEDAASMARAIISLPNVELEGVFSHFALADTADKSFAMQQVRLFAEACDAIEHAGIHIPIRHIAESAAILDLPDVHFDMVRAGIIQYGIWPSSEVTRPITLRPAMKFCARIAYIKTGCLRRLRASIHRPAGDAHRDDLGRLRRRFLACICGRFGRATRETCPHRGAHLHGSVHDRRDGHPGGGSR